MVLKDISSLKKIGRYGLLLVSQFHSTLVMSHRDDAFLIIADEMGLRLRKTRTLSPTNKG